MYRHRLVFFLSLLFVLLSRPVATGEESTDAPTADERVATALAAHLATPPRLLTAEVKRPAASTAGIRTMLVGMGNGGRPFEGRLEVWRKDAGGIHAALLSESGIPGIGIWMDGDDVLLETRQRDEEPGFDPASVRSALLALLDDERFVRWCRKASWTALDDESASSGRYEAKVSRRLVPPSPPPSRRRSFKDF